MKLELDFNKPFVDLDDEPIKEPDDSLLMMGKFLGNAISSASVEETKDPRKFDEWARAMYKGDTIIVDNSDYDRLYNFISHLRAGNIIIAALLRELSEQKENYKSKKDVTDEASNS